MLIVVLLIAQAIHTNFVLCLSHARFGFQMLIPHRAMIMYALYAWWKYAVVLVAVFLDCQHNELYQSVNGFLSSKLIFV